MHYDARPRYDACVLVEEGVDYPRRRLLFEANQTVTSNNKPSLVHAHRCRLPLPCKTHKVPNVFVLRSVLSRLRLHFAEQGPPCLPYHDVLPSL
jgi:hypothetical protein